MYMYMSKAAPKKAIPESYSIAEARDQLPRLVHHTEREGPIELTRRGRAVAVILSVLEYRRLTEKPDLFEAYSSWRQKVDPAVLPDEDLFADVRDKSAGRKVRL